MIGMEALNLAGDLFGRTLAMFLSIRLTTGLTLEATLIIGLCLSFIINVLSNKEP